MAFRKESEPMANFLKELEPGQVFSLNTKLAAAGLSGATAKAALRAGDARLEAAVAAFSAALQEERAGDAATLASMIGRLREACPDMQIQGSAFTDANFPVRAERFDADGVMLVTLKRAMYQNEVSEIIARRNLKPATIEQLLAWGIAKRHDREAVVALGSTLRVSGQLYVPYLTDVSGRRILALTHFSNDTRWEEYYRFLAVPR